MDSSVEKEKRHQFRKFTYRGVALSDLIKMPVAKFVELLPSNMRRRFRRGITQREATLLKRCAAAKKGAIDTQEKPRVVNTHSRTMIVLPQMVGNTIGVYNGKSFIQVEVKAEMIGYILKDFSDSKSASLHGKPGAGATASSKFVPLK